ncbi:hypothetical protein HMPREF0494_0799 [Limosilactobacillus antri DSM 16041]|uniref:Uncharacterized protein n=1 Tax=Limosilactobacillus antri DSM 16041 TaxID=525309 RepID=C8P655_9LACO|nr:hypothetical protein HMPREF0494_0799 [Limosilactobacillus antri DSM 16041]
MGPHCDKLNRRNAINWTSCGQQVMQQLERHQRRILLGADSLSSFFEHWS